MRISRGIPLRQWGVSMSRLGTHASLSLDDRLSELIGLNLPTLPRALRSIIRSHSTSLRRVGVSIPPRPILPR